MKNSATLRQGRDMLSYLEKLSRFCVVLLFIPEDGARAV